MNFPFPELIAAAPGIAGMLILSFQFLRNIRDRDEQFTNALNRIEGRHSETYQEANAAIRETNQMLGQVSVHLERNSQVVRRLERKMDAGDSLVQLREQQK